jgi:hypothetical protein
MRSEFNRAIQNYVIAMDEGDAALFIGAGVSLPAGFVTWKALLCEVAEDLGLDVERETDLVAVAQYHLNRNNRDRSQLNQLVRRAFDKTGNTTAYHELISSVTLQIKWRGFLHFIWRGQIGPADLERAHSYLRATIGSTLVARRAGR